jgi:pimeloyl-ACP methyl ester carboxylesterase
VPALRAAGHDVHCPTLTGLGERAHLASPDVGLATHVDDVANVLFFQDLHDVILVGSSSAGIVIAAVADRMPERIARLVHLDAFVPADGQSLWDMIPPDRRAAREQLVASEGDGWLLPRFAAERWEEFVPAAWGITDEASLRWVLSRLRPTPFRHFTDPVELHLSEDQQPRRVYVRCRWPSPAFDRFAATASASSAWRSEELAFSHLPPITDPGVLAALLVDL